MGKPSVSQHVLIISGTLCILLLGIAVTGVGYFGYTSESLLEADKLIQVNTSNEDGSYISIAETFFIIAIAGVVTTLGSLVGFCGVLAKNRCCLSLFTLISVGFGCFFIAEGVSLGTLLTTLGPTLQKSVQDTCRDDVFPANARDELLGLVS